MNAYTAIRAALAPFKYPCVPNLYTGKENKFFTYNYASINGNDFGDDRPGCNVASVQVHLFLPVKENFIQTMNSVQQVLFDEGFTWPSVTMQSEYDEIETEQDGVRQGLDGVRHIIFSCEYEETIG